jgi:hypothetical protein
MPYLVVVNLSPVAGEFCSAQIDPVPFALPDQFSNASPCPTPARITAISVKTGEELRDFRRVLSVPAFQRLRHELNVARSRGHVLIGEPAGCHHVCLKVVLIAPLASKFDATFGRFKLTHELREWAS